MIDSSLRYARPARRTPIRAWYATATSPIPMKPPMAGAWAAGNHSADGLPSIAGAEVASVVDAAVTGADAVISALGPSLDRKAVERPLVAGTANILDAMRHHGVTRYISLATPSVGDPHEKATPVSYTHLTLPTSDLV